MRTIRTLFLVAMACIAKAIDTTGGLGLVLSEKVMKLVHTSAILSALAYEENPPHGDFQHFGYYDSEPDQALVAKYKGYCYGAYRGTTLTWDDWQQNLVIGNHQVCGVNETVCCSTRLGFWQAYDTDYRAEMEEALEACAAECENPKECVVLTGHSQGGAIAAVAGLNLAHLDPYVITFGQPATIDQPCGLITSERWYRFINTKASSTRAIGIVYDPVPFVPGLGADHFGNAILLSSEDSSGVAYMGLDAQEAFGPLNINGFEAHSMSANASAEDYTPGYLDQIGALLEYYATNQTYPVRTTGYKIGSLCSQDIECETNLCQRDTTFSYRRCAGLDCKEDTECPETGRCDNGVCLPRLGSCMECNEDSDCLSNKCSWNSQCAGEGGLMDNECGCFFDGDCRAGRCEGVLHRICEAKLGLGASCNEASDCLSGDCSWNGVCVSSEAMNTPTVVETPVAPHNHEQTAVLMNKFVGMIAVIVLGAAVLLLLVYRACIWCKARRQGYEQIPAELIV